MRTDLIDVRLEHDHGPDKGLAQIAGTVTDMTSAFIPGARIEILRTEYGRKRDTIADAAGGFSFPALIPGRYQFRATARGFETSERTLNLAARALSTSSVQLAVGSETETVTVGGTGCSA